MHVTTMFCSFVDLISLSVNVQINRNSEIKTNFRVTPNVLSKINPLQFT